MHRSVRYLSLLLALFFCISPLCACAILFPNAGGTSTTSPQAASPTLESGYDLVLRYDDRIKIEGKFLRVNTVKTDDSALLRSYPNQDESFILHAVGVGSCDLYIKQNGTEVCLRVLVKPSPLNILLMLGEEAAHGTASTAIPSPRSADGLIYYTTSGEIPLGSLPNSRHESVRDFAPTRLTNSTKNLSGSSLPIPLNELTTTGAGRYAGLSAPIAYQLVERTGERVWMINLAQANASILHYVPDATDPQRSPALFRNALALWKELAGVLEAELDSGHYTVSRFGFFFCQGESDAAVSESAYYEAFSAMKQALDTHFTFSEGEHTRSLDFGGVILPHSTAPSATLAESGARAAQRRIAKEESGPLGNVYLLSSAVDAWRTDAQVAAYFARYDFRSFFLYYGYEPPKTVAELFTNSGSYTAAACNELGYDAVRTLLSLGE